MGVLIQNSSEGSDIVTPRHERTVLQSWKEIASELDRGVRTVQRWEQSLGLPVHRLGKGARCPVFAFKDELQLWFRNEARTGDFDTAINGQLPKKGPFGKARSSSRVDPSKPQARLLQSINDLFATEGSRPRQQQCKQCESPMRYLEGHFCLYGTDIEWSIPIPYCPDCDKDIEEKSSQSSLIH